MSETSARARRFARWFGSFERKGFSGRRAPESLAADGIPAEGVIAGDTGDVAGVEAARADGGGALGRNGGAIGGAVNSGSPAAGDGGVAVAAALVRSRGSGLADAAGVGLGAAVGGTDRGGVTVPVSRGGGDEKIPSFHVLRGVGVGRAVWADAWLVPAAVTLLPEEGVA